jgi:hypothetical protein
MFGASSIPVWTAVAAFGGLLQVIVLIVTACFVRSYLQATEDLRDAARKQVDVANDLLEAQIRPALVARATDRRVVLVNVGTGPAVNIVLSPTERGAAGFRQPQETQVFEIGVTFLAAGGQEATKVTTHREWTAQESAVMKAAGIRNGMDFLQPSGLNGRSLHCQYESLSGQIYWTVVDFDEVSRNAASTRFYVDPISR